MSTDEMQTVRLETARLVLRAARASDSQALFPILSDPDVMKYWSSLPHENFDQTQNWVDSMVTSPQNGTTDFVILDRATSIPIGKIGIWDGNEIGFLLAKPYWRRGLISEALNRLLPYFYNEKAFVTIVADVDPSNAASLSVLQKFGFKEVGRRERTFQIGDAWVDSVDLELTKRTWMKQQSKKRQSICSTPDRKPDMKMKASEACIV